MDFQRLLRSRRMVRNFATRSISEQTLNRILESGRRAPSAGFTQGWAFLVLRGATETGRYWDAVLPSDKRPSFPWPGLLNAPVLIVPLAHEQAYRARYAERDKATTPLHGGPWETPYWHIDTAFATMLMLLAAEDEGLGALFFAVANIAAFRAAFGVPDEYHPIGAIAIGQPLPDRPSSSLRRGRRPAAEVIHRGRW